MNDSYIQPSFYSFSEDSVYLAKFIFENHTKKDCGNILEVGAGCGVVSIETLMRMDSFQHLTLIERQEDFKNYLETNIKSLLSSKGSESIKIIYEDFLNTSLDSFTTFDLIYFNPPYFYAGEGRESLDVKKEACRRMRREDFIGWLKRSSDLLNSNGNLFFCHRDGQWQASEFGLTSKKVETTEGAFFYHWLK